MKECSGCIHAEATIRVARAVALAAVPGNGGHPRDVGAVLRSSAFSASYISETIEVPCDEVEAEGEVRLRGNTCARCVDAEGDSVVKNSCNVARIR